MTHPWRPRPWTGTIPAKNTQPQWAARRGGRSSSASLTRERVNLFGHMRSSLLSSAVFHGSTDLLGGGRSISVFCICSTSHRHRPIVPCDAMLHSIPVSFSSFLLPYFFLSVSLAAPHQSEMSSLDAAGTVGNWGGRCSGPRVWPPRPPRRGVDNCPIVYETPENPPRPAPPP